MPDKKLMTFVEWLAGKSDLGEEAIKGYLRTELETIIIWGLHNKDCTDKNYFCTLCELERRLTEYHKYFKEK